MLNDFYHASEIIGFTEGLAVLQSRLMFQLEEAPCSRQAKLAPWLKQHALFAQNFEPPNKAHPTLTFFPYCRKKASKPFLGTVSERLEHLLTNLPYETESERFREILSF